MFESLVSAVCNLPPLCYALVALATALYWKTTSGVPKNIPPFPEKPLPIFGNLLSLRKNQLERFRLWKKKAGDIYSLYMGQDLTVVIGGFEVLKEAFVKQAEHISARSHRFVDLDPRFNGGIVDTSGPLWKEQRSVSMAILKTLGLGKNWIGELVTIEVDAYLKVLSMLKEKPSDVRLLTTASVSNVICTMLVGQRFELDDPHFKKILSTLDLQFVYLRSTSVVKCFPWLQHLPGDMFNAKKMLNNEELFKVEFSTKCINQVKESIAAGCTSPNFISLYLEEERKRKNTGQPTTLSHHNLTMVLTNMLQGGTETVSTTIQWAMLYCLYYPLMQEKMYREIVSISGTDAPPTVEHKLKMVYVNAFILETIRMSRIVTINLPHLCTKTTTVCGYTIPEGTSVLADIANILHDPRAWGDPEVFRPERFLDENNELVVPESFVAFSLGRRFCMGDSLAKTELFLFMTGLLHRFRLQPAESGSLPSLEPVFGLTTTPKPFKLIFVHRAGESRAS